MATFNKLGQWTLSGNEGSSLMKGVQNQSEVSSRLEKPSNIKGADVFKEAMSKIASGNLPVIGEAQTQPTNEQLFGHLVASKEEIKKKEENWENTFKKHLSALSQPIDHLNKTNAKVQWGYGKSFIETMREQLSEAEFKAEMAARNNASGGSVED